MSTHARASQQLMKDKQPETIEARLIDRDLLKTIPLPQYSDEASKNGYGKLLIIGGSASLPGAVILAARAALRCGCGTVRLATPRSIAIAIGVAVPELMLIALPETPDGTIAQAALELIEKQYAECQSVVVGPGMGAHDETDQVARAVVANCPLPLLVDAQALIALGEKGNSGSKKGARIFTPHPGEMAALLGRDAKEIEVEREQIALDYARANGVSLVLKGRETLVSDSNGALYKNTAGTRGLGTAGSGDVLAGAVGGLLAQGMTATSAAAWGVHLHALAGESAEKDLGDDGMMARDFLERLPQVMRFLRRATDAKESVRTGFRSA